MPKRMPFAWARLIVSFVKSEIDLSLWKRVPSKSERMIDMFSIFNYGEVLGKIQGQGDLKKSVHYSTIKNIYKTSLEEVKNEKT